MIDLRRYNQALAAQIIPLLDAGNLRDILVVRTWVEDHYQYTCVKCRIEPLTEEQVNPNVDNVQFFQKKLKISLIPKDQFPESLFQSPGTDFLIDAQVETNDDGSLAYKEGGELYYLTSLERESDLNPTHQFYLSEVISDENSFDIEESFEY